MSNPIDSMNLETLNAAIQAWEGAIEWYRTHGKLVPRGEWCYAIEQLSHAIELGHRRKAELSG